MIMTTIIIHYPRTIIIHYHDHDNYIIHYPPTINIHYHDHDCYWQISHWTDYLFTIYRHPAKPAIIIHYQGHDNYDYSLSSYRNYSLS